MSTRGTCRRARRSGVAVSLRHHDRQDGAARDEHGVPIVRAAHRDHRARSSSRLPGAMVGLSFASVAAIYLAFFARRPASGGTTQLRAGAGASRTIVIMSPLHAETAARILGWSFRPFSRRPAFIPAKSVRFFFYYQRRQQTDPAPTRRLPPPTCDHRPSRHLFRNKLQCFCYQRAALAGG